RCARFYINNTNNNRSVKSRKMYTGSSSQRSPKPSRRPEMAVLGHGSSPSKVYTSSISQPPSVRGSPVPPRVISSPPQPYRSRHYGVSRSSNNSPLNLPGESQVPRSISSSAFNTGGVDYGDGVNSLMMDVRASGSGHRSRSLSRPMRGRGYQSLERDPDREYVSTREPRQRSLDGGEINSRHARGRDYPLEQAMYRDREHRDMYYHDRESVTDSDPYRESGLYSDARTMHASPVHNVDKQNDYSRDNFVMELQSSLNELQNQYGSIKRELDVTTQKLGSSMHSIKTFWSPELKKERALRKEEAAKYALINDQMKILRSENQ
ncbi:uncharacterized protein LOC111084559, partial [Limulus polyphemus]|uniref:Uncharacterized protein LOC111084559 n=1 Tax=Limulus polyphemus TaxID=6850 RepID=A0ABM1RZZ3_LIMPO